MYMDYNIVKWNLFFFLYKLLHTFEAWKHQWVVWF